MRQLAIGINQKMLKYVYDISFNYQHEFKRRVRQEDAKVAEKFIEIFDSEQHWRLLCIHQRSVPLWYDYLRLKKSLN